MVFVFIRTIVRETDVSFSEFSPILLTLRPCRIKEYDMCIFDSILKI